MLKKSQTGFALHTILIALAAVAGVIAIGLFTKNQIAIQTERKQFLATQKEVNDLGTKLAKATNPDKKEAVAYCDYGHVKYGKGGRTCWVKYYLLYKDSDAIATLEVFEKIQKSLDQNKKYAVRDSKYLSSLKNIAFQSAVKDICSIAAYYNESQKSVSGVPSFIQPANSATVVVSCSGEAKAEHFPVKE